VPSRAPTCNGALKQRGAGVLSGALVSVCVQPLDVVRTRMQAEATRSGLQSMVGTMRTIYGEGGVRCAKVAAALARPGIAPMWSLCGGLHVTKLYQTAAVCCRQPCSHSSAAMLVRGKYSSGCTLQPVLGEGAAGGAASWCGHAPGSFGVARGRQFFGSALAWASSSQYWTA